MIRVLFSILCLITFSFSSQSQIIFEHPTNNAGGLSNNFDIALHNKFTNNSNQDTFRWVRKNNVLATSWESAVCDNIQCHDVIVDSAAFILKNGESFDFIIHFYPYNKTGSGSMEVYVYAINDPLINTSSNYKATIWGLSTHNLTSSAFIYPNPVQDILNIRTEKNISSVNIFNLSGALVTALPNSTDANNFNIGFLNNGIYFAEINTSAGVMREKFVVAK